MCPRTASAVCLLLSSFWGTGCAAATPENIGFLHPEERPDTAGLFLPPPAPGSSRMSADEETYRANARWRGTPRWQLAYRDANVQFPQAANVFACAAGIHVTQQTTPQLYRLLQRTIIDAGKSTLPAKEKYKRPRPYVVHDDPNCLPDNAAKPPSNDAFPSGHASLGWAWALILTELVPDRAGAILARGYEFGQSRVICGLHWQSDVDAGRIIGSAVVARQHADEEFRAAMQHAAKELVRARDAFAKAAIDCAAEAEVLGTPAPSQKRGAAGNHLETANE
jgi:acid phosphatase (class A)